MVSDLIKKANAFAEAAHSGQFRDNGRTPYIEHPRAVAQLLMDHGVIDEEVIMAAYLHDTIEDTNVTKEDIVREFGKNVAQLVFEVTNPWDDQVKWEEKAILTYAHITYISNRAKLIKMADRICNLLEMDDWKWNRQVRYVANSLFIKEVVKPIDNKYIDYPIGYISLYNNLNNCIYERLNMLANAEYYGIKK